MADIKVNEWHWIEDKIKSIQKIFIVILIKFKKFDKFWDLTLAYKL